MNSRIWVKGDYFNLTGGLYVVQEVDVQTFYQTDLICIWLRYYNPSVGSDCWIDSVLVERWQKPKKAA